MKKVLGLLSSLLVFAGAKAQTPVKKETTPPVVVKPSAADSFKALKNSNAHIKLTDKALQLKNGNTLPMKENTTPIKQTVAKPDKH